MTSLKHLDLKSVPCPLNVVKIKLALEKLSKNEQLIVELDKGEPEEMVLNNLKEMGCLFKQIKENEKFIKIKILNENYCLLYTSPSPRDLSTSRMPSSA